LIDYGTPLGSLIDTFGLAFLSAKGYTTTVAVAGTTQDGSLYEGVWVEWAPGRVVELPIEMLVQRSQNNCAFGTVSAMIQSWPGFPNLYC
jgi:hypothetical protein